jgi:hypothetical protein
MIDYDLEYNAERPHLIIPEYGRHIQKLVDHCIALETKERLPRCGFQTLSSSGNCTAMGRKFFCPSDDRDRCKRIL